MGDGAHRRTRLTARGVTSSHTTAIVSAEKAAWLVAHLQAIVAASLDASASMQRDASLDRQRPGNSTQYHGSAHVYRTLSTYSPTPYDIPPGSQANTALVRRFFALCGIHREVNRNGQRTRHRPVRGDDRRRGPSMGQGHHLGD